jgi:stage V sporulation protein S
MTSKIIRVSTSSAPRLVAGAIAQSLRAERCAQVQAIGAGAVNQMVKSVVIASRYLEPEQIRPICQPTFVEVSVDGCTRTAIRLLIIGFEQKPAASQSQPVVEMR